MPAHINYETTSVIFYKFVCENPDIKSCYVGHTTNFYRREIHHKFSCNTKTNDRYNLKIYKIIRENGGWDNWKMVEIDRKICLDKSDACKIEQEHIEKLQANMNSCFAFRTEKQYYLDNKNEIAIYQKGYQLENKEAIAEQRKQFRLENKEVVAQQKKEYYLKNREKIILKKKEQFICECGLLYTYSCKARHLKTQKHQNYLATLNNIII